MTSNLFKNFKKNPEFNGKKKKAYQKEVNKFC